MDEPIANYEARGIYRELLVGYYGGLPINTPEARPNIMKLIFDIAPVVDIDPQDYANADRQAFAADLSLAVLDLIEDGTLQELSPDPEVGYHAQFFKRFALAEPDPVND